MFVTANDFNTPPYDLPNLAGNETFNDFVDSQEEEILVDLFGRFLYDELIAGAFEDGITGRKQLKPVEDIEERWLHLINGNTYTHLNRTYHWYGLKKMLIPYIYSKWLEFNTDHTTGVGVIVANTENSVLSSPVYKIVRAWNNFVDMAIGKYEYGYGDSSLYGFLYNSEAIYADVYPVNEYSEFRLYLFDSFRFPGYKNSLGI